MSEARMETAIGNTKRKRVEGRVVEGEGCDDEDYEGMNEYDGGSVTEEEGEKYEELAEEESVAWCRRFNDVNAMEAYIRNEKKEPQTQDKFVASLAKAALLKDSPDALKSECGRLYRWVWRFERVMGGSKTPKEDGACNVSLFVENEIVGESAKFPKCVLVHGWRWVMQLRMTDGKWTDWIQIKTSNRPGSSLAVFSARDFPKGSTIGYFCGETMSAGDTGAVRGKSRSVKRRNIGGSGDVKECVTYRNSKGKWQTVFARKVEAEEGGEQPLFFGMHYLNSPCYGYSFGSREYKKARKTQNSSLSEDGRVWASKKIYPDVEMLLL